MQGQCQSCMLYVGQRYCIAYPDGIPMPIFTGEVSHDTSQPGDDGIIRIPFPDVAPPNGYVPPTLPSDHDPDPEGSQSPPNSVQ